MRNQNVKMKKISIIVACYNEEGNIQELYNRVIKVFKNLDYDFEIIFVDNASTDCSQNIYKKIIELDERIKAVIMSRNFGTSQSSFFAGIKKASGESIVMIEGDLQDPPELISKFIEKWEEGYDVIYGVRKKRKGSILRRIAYKCFYRIFRMLSYLDIPLDSGDFCLIDRKVINVIKNLNEKDLYLRGLRSWAGFKQVGVEYIRDERFSGNSSIGFFQNFSWAKKAIVNFSYKPLELISRLTFMAFLVTILVAFFYLSIYFKTNAPRGFYTILMVIFVFGTIQLLALSIIAEYLIRIFQEVKSRPPYIIDRILKNKPSLADSAKLAMMDNKLRSINKKDKDS